MFDAILFYCCIFNNEKCFIRRVKVTVKLHKKVCISALY